MDFREFVRFLRTYVRLLVIATLIGEIVAVGFALTAPKSYTATSQVFFSNSNGRTGQDLAYASQDVLQRMATYRALATSGAVLDPVIAQLNLHTSYQALAGRVSTDVATGTSLLSIAVSQPDAKSAQLASLTVAQSLIKLINLSEIQPSAGGSAPSPTVSAEMVTSAPLPSAPSSPSPRLYFVGGTLIGLIVGLGIGLVSWLRRRWSADSGAATDVPDDTASSGTGRNADASPRSGVIGDTASGPGLSGDVGGTTPVPGSGGKHFSTSGPRRAVGLIVTPRHPGDATDDATGGPSGPATATSGGSAGSGAIGDTPKAAAGGAAAAHVGTGVSGDFPGTSDGRPSGPEFSSATGDVEARRLYAEIRSGEEAPGMRVNPSG